MLVGFGHRTCTHPYPHNICKHTHGYSSVWVRVVGVEPRKPCLGWTQNAIFPQKQQGTKRKEETVARITKNFIATHTKWHCVRVWQRGLLEFLSAWCHDSYRETWSEDMRPTNHLNRKLLCLPIRFRPWSGDFGNHDLSRMNNGLYLSTTSVWQPHSDYSSRHWDFRLPVYDWE